MNILLWILQVLLGLWNLWGGVYTLSHYEQIQNAWAAAHLPQPVWIALAAFQILFSVGLVLPKTTRVAAIYLAANALLGCVLCASYAGFPGMLWGVIPALLAAFVAYGRKK
jgi:hypothetical protein